MDTGADGQPMDMKEAQVKFKVKQNLICECIWWTFVNVETLNGLKSGCNKKVHKLGLRWGLHGYSEHLVGNIWWLPFQEAQKERETQLAGLLRERIDRYMRGDKVGFTTWAQEEGHQLAEAGEYISKETEVQRLILP